MAYGQSLGGTTEEETTSCIDMIENYKDLPLGKYIEIQDICKEEGLNELERQSAILAVLCDSTPEEMLLLPILEYRQRAIKSRFLEEEPVFPKRVAREYRLGEWTLIPTTDIGKMTTAQYTDFTELQKEADLVLLLSCLLVPKGHRYLEDYDVKALQADLRTAMPTTDALALSAFFLTSWLSSIRSILLLCRWETRKIRDREKRRTARKTLKEMTEDLVSAGVG